MGILFGGIIGFIIVICFIVSCVSTERTKNEVIQIKALLENINKIEIARYKKDFNIQDEKKSDSQSVSLNSTSV